MMEMLVQQYQQGLLQSLRITKFTGDPLEYSTFIRSFESQIESKVKPSDVCLCCFGTVSRRRTKGDN